MELHVDEAYIIWSIATHSIPVITFRSITTQLFSCQFTINALFITKHDISLQQHAYTRFP